LNYTRLLSHTSLRA